MLCFCSIDLNCYGNINRMFIKIDIILLLVTQLGIVEATVVGPSLMSGGMRSYTTPL